MTPSERNDPKILNASRRKRIAAGSGVTVTDVNQLVERFFEAKKMMGKMAGQMGMPGGGLQRSATKKKPKGRKGKGGKRKPMRQMPGGMPGMPPGMPDMAQLQQQLGAAGGMPNLPGMPKLPKGMENIDLDNLDFGKGGKK
jgi:signal recognition particle subunit SRP54